MQDKIEKLGASSIQHGKFNDRIYLMKLADQNYPEIVKSLDNLARQNNYTKIFAKVRERHLDEFLANNYEKEAFIPDFYADNEKAFFVGKFLDDDRQNVNKQERIDKVIQVAKNKSRIQTPPKIDSKFDFRIAEKSDADSMVNVYKEVFPTYPFPIHDPDYIQKTMDENIIYFGIWKGNQLIALSSSEMDRKEKNVEMTDFATLPEFRGNSFALFLLDKMEQKMNELGIKTFYTIARSVSFGMNVTFAKKGYKYTGTLKNNTNISGNIESMNVWYKNE
ncbi:MAG TPA: putative beta-lysine N-acetyltransferase [bacterium]|nr:putative beta-lysine N-acetyltransferase [bacterium]